MSGTIQGQATVHLSQLQPGIRVQDNLRYRKTAFEITSPPRETVAGMMGQLLEETGKPVASSWLVGLRDLRTNRVDVTRIDCDTDGHTGRFNLMA